MSIPILIVIILAPIALILLSVAFVLVKKNITMNARKQNIERLTKKINKHRISKIESVLQRVNIIIKGNKEFTDLFKELERYYEKISTHIRRLLSDSSDITVNYKTISKKEYLDIITRIEDNISIVETTEKSFEKTSKQLIQQEEFLNDEHLFFSKIFREAVDVYRVKRIQLNKIAEKIDFLSEKIAQSSLEFMERLSVARNKDASISLRKYASLVRKFVKVVSESPQIESYIYSTIPEIINKLTSEYKEKKKILNSPLGHINFKNSLLKISDQYNNAKKLYKSLRVDDSKEMIRKILKSIKMLERMINYEITARNFFISNYEKVMNETKITLQRFVSIRKQISSMIEGGKAMTAAISLQLKEAKILSSEVDNKAMEFKEMLKRKEIPYSTKVARMKMLLQRDSLLTSKMNEILQQLWSINIESSLIKNKFRKSEASINEILANIKKQNIHLSDEEKEQYEDIARYINALSNAINKKIFNKEVRLQVDELMKKSAGFYNIVGGNIKIAEIITNLIKHLAPERATNATLNVVLNDAERQYLEGNYAESLNIIIRELEKRGE